MKKLISLVILLCTVTIVTEGITFMPLPQSARLQTKESTDILISAGTKNTDLIYRVNSGDGRLYQAYLGAKLMNIEDLRQSTEADHPAYATFGLDNLFEPAVRMTHNDGNPSLELKYVSQTTDKPEANIIITNILLKDPQYPVQVTLHIKSYQAEDVIEQWVEIVPSEAKPVTIYNYASSMLHFDATKYWLMASNKKCFQVPRARRHLKFGNFRAQAD